MTPNSVTGSFAYEYKDSEWGDLLTNYRYISLTYDALGNPLSYYNGASYTFTWKNGRRLATAVKGSNSLSFEYNDDGIRTSKTVNGVEHTYYLNGSKILSEMWDDKVVIYVYDADGSPIGMRYRDSSYSPGVFAAYWYTKNMQGDIVSVYSSSGTLYISYSYDAWGNVTTTYSNGGNNLGAMYNPFKYRGYYHDTETGFYYLNSRYYDPATGRFINPDSFVATGQGLSGYNMFAYCGNNPITRTDPDGEGWGLVILAAIVLAVCLTSFVSCDSNSGEANNVEEEDDPNNYAAAVCEKYDTEEEAAIGVSKYMEKLFNSTDSNNGGKYEYAATIFQFPGDDHFYFCPDFVYTSEKGGRVKYRGSYAPDNAIVVAFIHSHPWQNDIHFSQEDKNIMYSENNLHINYYLLEFERYSGDIYAIYRFRRYVGPLLEDERIWPRE